MVILHSINLSAQLVPVMVTGEAPLYKKEDPCDPACCVGGHSTTAAKPSLSSTQLLISDSPKKLSC